MFGYDKEQLKEIQLGIKHRVNVRAYSNKCFDSEQMREIREGLEAGIDVSLYNTICRRVTMHYDWSEPAFTAWGMKSIKEALILKIDERIIKQYKSANNVGLWRVVEQVKKGVDINKLLEKGYSCIDIENICEVIYSESDASIDFEKVLEYVKPGMDYTLIVFIVYGLYKGVDVTSYSKFNIWQLTRDKAKTLVDLHCQEFNIPKYINEGYNYPQIEQIYMGKRAGIDISIYSDPTIPFEDMQEIRYGLETRLDVSKYASKHFNAMQKRVIREGLESGIDVSVYAKPEITASHMDEIKERLIGIRDARVRAALYDKKIN